MPPAPPSSNAGSGMGVPPSAVPRKSRKKLVAILGCVAIVVVVAVLIFYEIGPVQGNLLIGYSYTGSSQAAWSVTRGCGGNVPITYPNHNTGAAYTCVFTLTNHDPSASHEIASATVTGTGYLSEMSPTIGPTGLSVPSGGSQTISITFGCPLPPGQYEVSVEFIVN